MEFERVRQCLCVSRVVVAVAAAAAGRRRNKELRQFNLEAGEGEELVPQKGSSAIVWKYFGYFLGQAWLNQNKSYVKSA